MFPGPCPPLSRSGRPRFPFKAAPHHSPQADRQGPGLLYPTPRRAAKHPHSPAHRGGGPRRPGSGCRPDRELPSGPSSQPQARPPTGLAGRRSPPEPRPPAGARDPQGAWFDPSSPPLGPFPLLFFSPFKKWCLKSQLSLPQSAVGWVGAGRPEGGPGLGQEGEGHAGLRGRRGGQAFLAPPDSQRSPG